MHVYLHAGHRYPAHQGGPGGGRVFDWLAKGLAEKGHRVSYHLDAGVLAGWAKNLPPNLNFVESAVEDADIYHIRSDNPQWQYFESNDYPWVATCHVDLAVHGMSRSIARDNWIFVSRRLAATYGMNRYVDNGIDPDELMYCEKKSNYLLFVCALPLARRKGLERAVAIAKATDRPLKVAGSDRDPRLVASVTDYCRVNGVEYLGEIRGREKAEVFAHAAALIFPTEINEAFGLVLAEALMCGTPVICSDQGACPDIVNPGVGFVCASDKQYCEAVEQLSDILPANCRELAECKYHYSKMTDGYLMEYEYERTK